MSEVLVIGHRNPDTDAICSAIGYAEFKRRTGMRNAVAARCGDINDRIDFVLRTFGMAPPKFVADVSPKVQDVMRANVFSVPPRTPLVEALALMDEKNIRVLPVLDHERRCLGLLSVFKASKFFFPSQNRIWDSRRVVASVRSLTRTLQAKMLCMFEPDREEDLVLMIGAMQTTSFASRLPSYAPEKLLVVVGDREEIQLAAIEGRARCVIITGGYGVSDRVRDLAQQQEVSLVISPHDTTTTAMLCRSAIAVEHLLRRDYLAFRPDELLTSARRLAAPSQFQAFPVVGDDDRVIGIVTKSDFLRKVERQLILVDHNELSQAVQGADQVEILEIIDHHRVGSFSSQQAILFRNEPVGSTSTIVADLYLTMGVEMPPGIAGCLLAGLVSDTLNLTSPTSTRRDAEVLAILEQLAGVNAKEFIDKLFSSGSVLTSKSPLEAITTDCKEYSEGGRTFSVAQIEELGFDQFWKRKAEVVEALNEYCASKRYFFSALLVTDVVRQTSLLLLAGDRSYRQKVHYPEDEPGIFKMVGVVSRKKQLLPYLTQSLRDLQVSGETRLVPAAPLARPGLE
jgi:manganese-dependent inorganic pyrophosphatase